MIDRHEFFNHLRELRRAIDETQPPAPLDGNLKALHALVRLENTLKQVTEDVTQLWAEERETS